MLNDPLVNVIRSPVISFGMTGLLYENAMLNRLSFNPKFRDGKPTMFICGNDQEAKKTVTGILNQFGWETADMGKAEDAAVPKNTTSTVMVKIV